MRTRFLIFMALNALLWGCASFPQCERGTGMGKGEPPVIFDSHAASAIRLGGTWRIYLHAKDADGDMRFLVAIINQTGVASYPTSFTPVKEEDSREVAGYLFLNTSARDRNLINDRLTLTLFVRDGKGSSWPGRTLFKILFLDISNCNHSGDKTQNQRASQKLSGPQEKMIDQLF